VFTPGGGQPVSWEQQWSSYIPEPKTWLLSGGALVLIALWGRAGKQKYRGGAGRNENAG